ncbi:MAG: hypothetical protein ACW98I_15865, partial [Candidatus Hodarchaeales archaeon]
GFAFAGGTESVGAGGQDFWLVKTNATGQAEWNQTYGGINDEFATTVIQTADEGFVLVGTTQSYGAGLGDAWLVKTDTNGNQEWNKTFGGTDWDVEFSLLHTDDGGFALAGDTSSYGAGASDFWLVKMDANGQAEWNKTYGGTGGDDFNSMIQTTDGGFALVGITGMGIYGNFMWLVKTDANGQAEWNHTFGETTSEGPVSLVQTTDGGYAFVGTTTWVGAGNGGIWLVKVSVSEVPPTTTATTTDTTTTPTSTTTTTQASPSWTPLVILMAITALLTFRKRKKNDSVI